MMENRRFLFVAWIALSLAIVTAHGSKNVKDLELDECFETEKISINNNNNNNNENVNISNSQRSNNDSDNNNEGMSSVRSESDENGIYNGEDDQEENGKFDFSVELFHQLYNEDEDTNLFFSPHSIHEALTSALFGAKGETLGQLRKTLHVNVSESKSDLIRKYMASRKYLRNSTTNSVDFSSVTRLYFAQDEPIRPCVKSILGEVRDKVQTGAEGMIEFINFQDSDNATKTINKWVESETKGKIKDLVPPGDLSAESRIALVNSAYFKGTWAQEFDKAQTKTSLFHISPDKITQTMMMYLKGNFQHGATDLLKSYILDMPYKGNSHSMIILLPPFTPGALNETLSRLNSQTLRSSIDELRNAKNSEFSFNDEVEIYLPRFKIEQTIDLTKNLASLGVNDLFNPEAADLSDFSEKSGLSFNSAMHKSFLEVNEEGAEAAAATSFITARRGRLHPLTRYVVNRPFIFFIVDNTNHNDLLFMGVFKNPKMAKKSAQ